MKKLGILGAMDAEVASLKEHIDHAIVTEIAGYVFYEGNIGNRSVVIVKCGIGKVNAALCTQLLIVKFGAEAVINTGIAGAIDGKLRIFDFVVSTDTIYHDFDATFFGYDSCTIPGMPRTFLADKTLTDAAEHTFSSMKTDYRLYTGRIASGDQFISGAPEKNAIKDRCTPMCVEMEGCAAAHTCSIHKIPFVIIRCISDMADISEKKIYDFNEETAAGICAEFVYRMIKEYIPQEF